MKKNTLTWVFILVFFLVVSIGEATLFLAKKSAKVVPISAPRVTQTTAPQFDELQGRLFSDFPEFPVYPGAQVKISRKQHNATPSVNGYSTLWEVDTKTNVPDIVNWYTAALKKDGWTMDTEYKDSGLTERSFKAYKNGQGVTLTIEQGEGVVSESTQILVDIPTGKI